MFPQVQTNGANLGRRAIKTTGSSECSTHFDPELLPGGERAVIWTLQQRRSVLWCHSRPDSSRPSPSCEDGVWTLPAENSVPDDGRRGGCQLFILTNKTTATRARQEITPQNTQEGLQLKSDVSLFYLLNLGGLWGLRLSDNDVFTASWKSQWG